VLHPADKAQSRPAPSTRRSQARLQNQIIFGKLRKGVPTKTHQCSQLSHDSLGWSFSDLGHEYMTLGYFSKDLRTKTNPRASVSLLIYHTQSI
jgi:hypothetical protein